MSKRNKGCALCNPSQWRGQGFARKRPFRDLRRIGFKRRLNTRYLTDVELRDNAPTLDAEERYLDSIDEIWAQSSIGTATGVVITRAELEAERARLLEE